MQENRSWIKAVPTYSDGLYEKLKTVKDPYNIGDVKIYDMNEVYIARMGRISMNRPIMVRNNYQYLL
jgi:hypothetical protein